jgi:ABC-type multidrug transport system ATPase subunit
MIKNVVMKFCRDKVVAVDDLSLSVPRNTLLVLYVRNGSVKTTMKNMLSAAVASTSDDALIYGLSVRTEHDAIRSRLGVCSQFDVYWDKLSGREQHEIFSALKGRVGGQRKEEVAARLDGVGLTEAANRYAGNYSDGMQRRLSVALVLTGVSELLFLDEANTVRLFLFLLHPRVEFFLLPNAD